MRIFRHIRLGVVVTAMLCCVAAHGDNIDMIIRCLQHESISVKRSAYLAASRMNIPGITERMSVLLKNNSHYVAPFGATTPRPSAPYDIESLVAEFGKAEGWPTWSCAMALANTKDVQAAKALASYISGEKSRYVISAIPTMGDVAIEPLVEIIHKGDPKGVYRAITALSLIDGKAATDTMLTLAKSSDGATRAHALGLLDSRVNDKRVVEVLLQGLESDNIDIRLAAMSSIQNATAPYHWNNIAVGVNPDLLHTIDVYLPPRKVSAPWAVEPMVKVLRGPHSELYRSALCVLSHVGDYRALDTLVELVQDKTYRGFCREEVNAKSAVTALGRIKSPKSVKALAGVLEDRSSRAQADAARALGEIGFPSARRPLLNAMKYNYPELRSEVLVALASVSKRDALPYLMEALKTDIGYTYSSALYRGFDKMGDYALPALLDCLKNIEDRRLGAVISALGRIKSPESVESLLKIYEKQLYVRTDIEMALHAIGQAGVPRLACELSGHNNVTMSLATKVLMIIAIDTARNTPSGRNLALEALIKDAVSSTVECKLSDPQLVQKLSTLVMNDYHEKQLQKENSDKEIEARKRSLRLEGRGFKAPYNVDSLIAALDKVDAKDTRERWNLWDIMMALTETKDTRATKALVARLEGESALCATHALPCMGDMALQPIMEEINMGNPKTIQSAIWALTMLKGKSALDILLKLAQGYDKTARCAAIQTLGSYVDDKRALEIILAAVKSDDNDLQGAAMWAISVATDPRDRDLLPTGPGHFPYLVTHMDIRYREVVAPWAVMPMVELLQSLDTSSYNGALEILARVADERALDVLDKLVHSWDKNGRVNSSRERAHLIACIMATSGEDIAAALGRIKSAKSVEALVWMLNWHDRELCPAIIRALGQTGFPTAERPLLKALKDKDPNMQFCAATALAGVSKHDALPHILRLLNADTIYEYSSRKDLTDAFCKMGEYALPALMDYLKSSEAKNKDIAVTAIAATKSPQAVRALLETYKPDNNSHWVEGALRGMGNASVPQLVEQLSNSNSALRTAAMRILDDIAMDIVWKTPSERNLAIEAMINEIAKRDSPAREESIRILRKIGNWQTVDYIISVMDNSSSSTKTDVTEVSGVQPLFQ